MPGAPRETSVEHEVTIAAAPEIVFGYFTDPARMVEWMGAAATLDPRPGGVFRIVFRPSPAVVEFLGPEGPLKADEENVVLGEFVEVVPYTRIAFTWGTSASTSPCRRSRPAWRSRSRRVAMRRSCA